MRTNIIYTYFCSVHDSTKERKKTDIALTNS